MESQDLPAKGDRVEIYQPDGTTLTGTVKSVHGPSATAVVQLRAGGQITVPIDSTDIVFTKWVK